MLIVIEMNLWATVQGIAIAIDQRGPSGRMEMKEGAGATFRRQDRCLNLPPPAFVSGESKVAREKRRKKETKQVTGDMRRQQLQSKLSQYPLTQVQFSDFWPQFRGEVEYVLKK